MYRNILLLLLCSLANNLSAQTDRLKSVPEKEPLQLSVQAFYQRGSVFQTNDFVRGVNFENEKINRFHALAIRLANRTSGKREWERRFLNPRYGVGVYVADYFEAEQIGRPIAVYGFFNAPFYRNEKLSFNYEFGFGFTFNWRSFDPVTNQFNVALGAGRSFLIDAGINARYALSPLLSVELGASLTHFSNGGIKQPNFGINTIAPRLLLSRNLHPGEPYHPSAVTTDHIPKNEYLLTFFGGGKNLLYDSLDVDLAEKWEGVDFPVFGLSAVYHRHLTYKTKIGFGLGLSYDGSIAAQIAVDEGELEAAPTPFGDKLQVNAFFSYELAIHRIAILLEPSFYIHRKKTAKQTPVFHQRIGVKYYFLDDVSLGITLRSYQFHVSDFIEWSVGYRFPKHK